MSDIVEQLRLSRLMGQPLRPDPLCEIAATQIEWLRLEVERLQELLRGVGANRYWEGRWRDEKAENDRLRETDKLREAAFNAYAEQEKKDRAEVERLRAENQRLQADLKFYRDALEGSQ